MSDAEAQGWGRRGKIGFVAVLGSIAYLIASETVLRPDHEVFYTRPAITAVHCSDFSWGSSCAAAAQFAVANNGRVPQDDLRVTWGHEPHDTQRWSVSWRTSDLVASAKPSAPPQLRAVDGARSFDYEIHALVPNTVVDFEIKCLGCTREDLRAAQNAAFAVTGAGVTEADPRATMFVRFFTNVGRLIGVLAP